MRDRVRVGWGSGANEEAGEKGLLERVRAWIAGRDCAEAMRERGEGV